MTENSSQAVKSADNLFDVLETVHQLDDVGATAVADRLNIAKSTAYDHLTTLVDHEFLIKEGSTYRVGLKCLHYGVQAKGSLPVRPTRSN